MLANDILKTKHDTEVFMNGFVLGSGNETSKKAIIQPLSITENGIFKVPEKVDGFNPVLVNVPQSFTLNDIVNLPTIIEYTSGDSKFELKIKENGYQYIGISMTYYRPIVYYDNYLIYSVWYYKSIPFFAIPTSNISQKQIDYLKGDNDIYLREIDLYKNYQFNASVILNTLSQPTSVSLKYTYVFDQTVFDEGGSQPSHGEYKMSGSININPFSTTTSYGSALMSIEENPSEYAKMIKGFYSDFNIS